MSVIIQERLKFVLNLTTSVVKDSVIQFLTLCTACAGATNDALAENVSFH